MSSTQAQWPTLRSLIDWFKPSPYERDLEFLEQARGEEMERLRAHVRGRPEDLRWLVGREPGSNCIAPTRSAMAAPPETLPTIARMPRR